MMYIDRLSIRSFALKLSIVERVEFFPSTDLSFEETVHTSIFVYGLDPVCRLTI